MHKAIDDVRAFHAACDVPIVYHPAVPSAYIKTRRMNLIREEVIVELLPAMEKDDMIEIADAIADSIYVLIGAALEYGIPLHKVWNEVQRTNMAKVDPSTGAVCKRADGKILKPPGWMPPDIASILLGEGWK